MMPFVLQHADEPAFILDDSGVLEITGPVAASAAAPRAARGTPPVFTLWHTQSAVVA